MAGVDAGGIAGATAYLAGHGAAIEADLQRFYGLPLGDFPWPLTARRLRLLVEQLPADAAVWASLRDPTPPPIDPAATYAALERHGITIPDELRRR